MKAPGWIGVPTTSIGLPRRTRIAQVLLPGIVAAGVVLSSPAVASASCYPGMPNDSNYYFTGWNSPQVVYGEATANSSNIYNYPSPYVYPGSGDFSWVMLNGTVGTEYAQVGWVQDPGRNTFTEWNTHGVIGDNFSITPQTPGTTSWYEVDTLGGQISTDYCFFVNGNEVGGCSGYIGWYASYGEDNSEIHTAADQMPGGIYQPEVWNNAFLFNNNVQQNFNGSLVNYNPAWFNAVVYSQTMAQAGDAYCSS